MYVNVFPVMSNVCILCISCNVKCMYIVYYVYPVMSNVCILCISCNVKCMYIMYIL